MSDIDAWLRGPEAIWLLCGAVGAWIVYRGSRGAWRRWEAKRRRRAFDAREERRWQGHRRESASVSRFDKR